VQTEIVCPSRSKNKKGDKKMLEMAENLVKGVCETMPKFD
jgi:hypothetical protein